MKNDSERFNFSETMVNRIIKIKILKNFCNFILFLSII